MIFVFQLVGTDRTRAGVAVEAGLWSAGRNLNKNTLLAGAYLVAGLAVVTGGPTERVVGKECVTVAPPLRAGALLLIPF